MVVLFMIILHKHLGYLASTSDAGGLTLARVYLGD